MDLTTGLWHCHPVSDSDLKLCLPEWHFGAFVMPVPLAVAHVYVTCPTVESSSTGSYGRHCEYY